MRLKDKRAVITGGGSGIGLAIAERFAAEGAHVTILERDERTAEGALAKISGSGGASALVCDVADAAAVSRIFDALAPQNILVNNAGIAHIGNIEATDPDAFDRILAVNVKGVYHCTRAALPKMLEARNGGVILNMASVASKLGIADRFAYSASKGAVLSMTLSVARDYVDQGIRCNCLCPARVHTPFVDGYLAEHYPEKRDEMFAKLSAYQPIGRMARPSEIANLACFLCSDEAAFITGSAYDIDGGVTLLR
ncbi:MAG: SDR family oxidoreductase [Verrucomicrobiales bacterium]